MVSQTQRAAYMVTMMRYAVEKGVKHPVDYAVCVFAEAFDKHPDWRTNYGDPELHHYPDEDIFK